jgi:integrase
MHFQPNPRRVNVERGIYFRQTAAGRRYEIGYQASDGRWRWRVVEGGLKQARAARAEVTSKLARGERVAPSRRVFTEVADTWLATKTRLAPRTRQRYGEILRVHLLPPFAARRISDISEDDVLRLIAQVEAAGCSPGTARKALVVLSGILGYAARRGMVATNPVLRLERGERPQPDRREMRILDRDGIGRLLDAAGPAYQPLLVTAVFTGLRLGELLGLTWADLDLNAEFVRVRKQLDRSGERVRPKTRCALRDVELMPALGRVLRAHREQRFAIGQARSEDFVFGTVHGTPLHYRNVVRRGLDAAVDRAGLAAEPRLRFHDLRHTFASLLIAEGADVVFVSRKLGHASVKTTLDVYAHLFDAAKQGRRVRDALESTFGKIVESSSGNGRELARVTWASKACAPVKP